MTDGRQRFEAIFTEHHGAIVRYATRRVGVDAAQEVVAETFLVAWRRLADVPVDALPWLYATARRIVANEFRRRAREARTGERIEAETPIVSADHAADVAERLRIERALDTLSETNREVLLLTQWEQLSMSETAAVLGCSAATVRVRLHRARRRFAAALAPDEPEHLGLSLITDGERS